MLLLIEYLHANTDWYRAASPSMRGEGKAMLEAVAADVRRDGRPAMVMICPEARDIIEVSLPTVDVTSNSPADMVKELTELSPSAVLPIAPECDGVLANLVSGLRAHQVPVLSLSSAMLQIFGDKWLTYEFLTQHGIATVETHLPQKWRNLKLQRGDRCVIKPRDGAGCAGVQALPLSEIDQCLQQHEPGVTCVLQPVIDGVFFSMAIVGGGSETTILPPALQEIAWAGREPRYLGGRIPAEISNRCQQEAAEICRRVVELAGPFQGYCGVDFVLPDGSDSPVVMEVNPRMCTSYVGYRQATDTNLFSLVDTAHEPQWKAAPVRFDVPGA